MSGMTKTSDGPLPIWTHGPKGTLSVGEVNTTRLWRSMSLLVGSSVVLIYLAQNTAAADILCGAIFLSVRLARFDGNTILVDERTSQWTGLFAIASVLLLVVHAVAGYSGNGFIEVLSSLAMAAFFFVFVIYLTAARLINLDLERGKSAIADVSIDDLRAMREEIEAGRASFSSLPMFDTKEPALVDAWTKRDPQLIAALLQEGNLATQEGWSRVNTVFNRAQTYIDRARQKLSKLLVSAEQRLRPFNLNYDALEIEGSKLGYLEMSAAVPKSLTAKRINAQNTAFIQGGSRAVAQGFTGNVHPLAAVAMVGVSIAAHFIYKSRTLRRLKDAEGQLTVNAQAVCGDRDMVNSVLVTRLLPQFDGMIDVISRLEDGMADLQPDTVDASSTAQRDKATKMAFALIEGRKLVATAGGN